MTQTVGHLLRILYYGAIISVETLLPNWLFLAAAVTAVLGTGSVPGFYHAGTTQDFSTSAGLLFYAQARSA